MELVWARPPSEGTTVRDVFEVLYERRRSAYTTVMSTMTRLARKNLLRVVKADQAYIYYPNFTEPEFVSRFVSRILEDLLVGFTGSTLANIEKLSGTEEAARMRQLLQEVSRRREEEETP